MIATSPPRPRPRASTRACLRASLWAVLVALSGSACTTPAEPVAVSPGGQTSIGEAASSDTAQASAAAFASATIAVAPVEAVASGIADATSAASVTNAAGAPVASDPAAWAQAAMPGERTMVVDDWALANDSGQPQGYVSPNPGAGGNAMSIAPSALDRPERAWSIDVAYGITQEPPDDFVGFDRDLPEVQDWTGANYAVLDVDRSAAPGVDVVFQFREKSGEVWRTSVPSSDVQAGQPLVLPIDGTTFHRTDWSPNVNDRIDLGEIDQYGFYVGHTGPGRVGKVTLGAIAVARQ